MYRVLERRFGTIASYLVGVRLTHVLLSALYAYEYVVTLDQEAKYIWTYPNRGMTTWLLAANRYVALIAAAVYAIPMINYTVSDP